MEKDYRREEESSSRFADSQVIHDPRQVKSPLQLQVGKKYQIYHKKDKVNVLLSVLEIILISKFEEGKWFKVRIQSLSGGLSINYSKSMADYGIIPYDDGKWSATNYLIPVEEKSSEIKK